jgi:NDP-sugar pyrophosphorylase family protein
MQAVILAGGVGTRLKPFTVTVPKPLLPLGDRPIVEVLLCQLRESGFTSVRMCLGYMAPLFQAFLGDGSRHGLNIEYLVEDTPLGTAGALRLVPDLDEHFLVVNGDTLTDLSFTNLISAHKKAGVVATIFCAKIDDFVDYGIVEFDPANHILQNYIEKPTRHYYVSTGIYVLSRDILRFMDFGDAERLDMPDLLRAASKSSSVLCYTESSVYWRDIGRFDHYETASRDFQEAPRRFLKQLKASEISS